MNKDSLNPDSNKIEAIRVCNTKSKMSSNKTHTDDDWASCTNSIDSNPEKPSKVNEKHYHCDVTPKKEQTQKQTQPDAPKKLNTTNRASPNFNPKRLKFDS